MSEELLSYYNNGQIESKHSYTNDECVKHEVWYENGNKLKEANYKNNLFDGLYKEWYNNGKLNGLYESFYKNGDKETECNYS